MTTTEIETIISDVEVQRRLDAIRVDTRREEIAAAAGAQVVGDGLRGVAGRRVAVPEQRDGDAARRRRRR